MLIGSLCKTVAEQSKPVTARLCDETVKLSKIFAKTLDSAEGWNIINLALGNIEC